jgi:hypothetical protein
MKYFKKCHLENLSKRLKGITRRLYGVVCVMKHIGQNASEAEHMRSVLKVMSKLISRQVKARKGKHHASQIGAIYSLPSNFQSYRCKFGVVLDA